MEETEIKWKRWPENDPLALQYITEIDGVSCQIDTPYDDTVGFRIHVYRNHPGYPNARITASAYGDAATWSSATRMAERWARDIGRWCSGPTDEV